MTKNERIEELKNIRTAIGMVHETADNGDRKEIWDQVAEWLDELLRIKSAKIHNRN